MFLVFQLTGIKKLRRQGVPTTGHALHHVKTADKEVLMTEHL